MKHRTLGRWTLVAAVSFGLTAGHVTLTAAQDTKAEATVDAKQLDALVAKGLEFLKTKGQAENGSFSEQAGPAVTGLVVAAMIKSGAKPSDPAVAKGLKYLEGFVQKDGGVYKAENHRNYETCMAIMCFSAANEGGKYDKILKGAEGYVRGVQWDKGEGLEDSDVRIGGAGYGSKKRPDLSNTQFFLDALKEVGAGADDPAVQEALKFVSQCQNLESAHNTGTFAAKNPDGGFVYTAANEGDSMAGKLANGGLRSYGSMTYAGLKSMIYAGVKKDDPRVKAAKTWISKNYDLKTNPGMGPSGLFYYYHTFAKALDTYGEEVIEDAQGKKHPWRQELVTELAQLQKPDGSWINGAERWLEGDPNLVTGYALLTLSYCRPKVEK